MRLSRLLCGPCFFAVLIFALSFPAFAAKDSVPDWVRSAAAQTPAPHAADADAMVLLDETTLSVAPDGKAVEHRRRVIRILRPGGRDRGMVYVPFDKDTKILSMHVWSVGPDGHEYAVKDSDLGEFGMPGDGMLYEDVRFRSARPPGRDPGGVVAYEYEQRREPYLHEETWSFQDDLPRMHQSFTLELPPGFVYQAVWAHHVESKAIDLEHGRFRWDMPEVAAIDLDRVPMRPALDALAGRMTVHYAGPGQAADTVASWAALGTWYDGLTRDRLVATPELTSSAAALTAGKTDFYDKTEAVAEFVQTHIRYFVIEMGIGGYQPHPAGDIFRNGYGDCKDKATVLSAMLSTVGVHSALMIVDTSRGVVDPASPSMTGNHMVAAIEIPAGYSSPRLRSVVTTRNGRRYLVFDPTWDRTPFGQLESNLQGSYGVLLEGAQTEAVLLPVLSPELNRLRRTAIMALNPDGTLTGQVVEKRFGDAAEFERSLLTAGDAKDQSTYRERRLSGDFTSFSLKDIRVENVSVLNKDLTTTYSLSADRYGRTMGPLLMVRPRVLGTEGFALDRKARTVPVNLGQTSLVQDDFSITLPEGYAVDDLPEPIKLDIGFASYESATELVGNQLHYTRTCTVRAVTVPADRYGDLQKLALAIEADEQNRAVLKKK